MKLVRDGELHTHSDDYFIEQLDGGRKSLTIVATGRGHYTNGPNWTVRITLTEAEIRDLMFTLGPSGEAE